MKYITVRFPGSSREYTYECDDDTIQPTDEVEIIPKAGVPMTLSVVEVSDNKPAFPCKPARKL